jgi:hypothetical protein
MVWAVGSIQLRSWRFITGGYKKTTTIPAPGYGGTEKTSLRHNKCQWEFILNLLIRIWINWFLLLAAGGKPISGVKYK